MPEVPKIVRERLRMQASAEHPGPDLLNAFAEQALLPGERERILEHLAICEDCRAIVITALPPIEVAVPAEVASESQPARQTSKRGWFSRPLLAWQNLSWAALAAGLIVAGTLLLQHPAKEAQPVAVKQSPAAISQPANQPGAPASAMATNTVSAQIKAAEIQPKPARKGELVRDTGLPAELASAQKKDGPKMEAKALDFRNENAKEKAASPVPQAPAAEQVTVETSAAAVSDQAARTDKIETGTLLAKNEPAPPVYKAKLPTAEEQGLQARAKTAPATALAAVNGAVQVAGARMATAQPAAAQWSVSEGMLRRSLDGGTTWQTVMPDAHFLCSGALGNEVWAGGKSGALYHSADNGATWAQVHPMVADHSLSADITAIQMRSLTAVVLSTSNGESWMTSDSGKTWNRK